MRLIWFRKNAIVILLATVVGLLSISPSLLAMHALGEDYQGMPLYYLDDEDIYTARMREVLDGHWLVGSPFFHEYKDSIPTMLPIGEYVYALPALVTRIPLVDIVLATKFLFPTVLFLLVFFLFMELADEEGLRKPSTRLTGIASGFAVTLVYDVYSLMSSLKPDGGIHLSIWTRTVNPILGALAIFSFLIFFWRAIKGGKKSDIAIAGIIATLSFAYFFSWGMILSISSVLCLFFLVLKRWKELKRLLYVSAVGIVGSLPFLVLVVYSLSQGGSGSAEKNGMFFTHIPLLNKTLLATVAIFAGLSLYGFLVKKKKLAHEDWWIFSAAVILGALWTFSQQIVTGRTIWPYHFVQYSNPLAMFMLILAAYKFLHPRFPRIFSSLMVVFCLLGLVNGAVMATSYKTKIEDFGNEQKFALLYTWLNKNASEDCVVLVDEKIERVSRQIPAFTSCDVYLSSWMFSGIPVKRLRHNFFTSLEMVGVTAEGASEYLRQHPDNVHMYFFENWDQLFKQGLDSWVERRIDELVPQYQDFLNKDFAARLREYRLDYLVTEEPLSKDEMDWYGMKNDLGQIGSVYLYQ
ncbi:MAG: hypothetical protein ABIB04_05315 [Patescibacteria group bacterium]